MWHNVVTDILQAIDLQLAIAALRHRMERLGSSENPTTRGRAAHDRCRRPSVDCTLHCFAEQRCASRTASRSASPSSTAFRSRRARFGGPGIVELFTNRLDPAADPSYPSIASLRVSAHFVIRRDGELLQFVPCGKRAWHAGVSCWQGRERCNDFSVGIELEGTDAQALPRRPNTRCSRGF